MAGVTLNAVKQARANVSRMGQSSPYPTGGMGTWSSWATIGQNPGSIHFWDYTVSSTGDPDHFYLNLLRISVNVGDQRGLAGLSFTMTGANSEFEAYLYLEEPTLPTTGVNQFGPPEGYVKSATAEGVNPVITFTDIQLMESQYIYVWVSLLHTVTYSGGAYHIAVSSTASYSVLPSQMNITPVFYGMPTAITASPSNVMSGANISLDISNAYVTETVSFYYGSTLLGTAQVTNGIASVSCPGSWFDTAGVTTNDTIMVTAIVDNTNVYTTFYLGAGSDISPEAGTPTTAIVQAPQASGFPDTYIANITATKISADVTLHSNAGVDTVVISYPGGPNITMAWNSVTEKYEATTPPVTGDTTFTVTVTDVRGKTGTNTVTISGVVPYVPPSITIDEEDTWRCDANGDEENGGTYVRVKAYATYYTGLAGNSLTQFRFYVQEDPTSGANLTSGVQSAAVPFVAADNYGSVVVVVQDQLSGVITKSLRLAGQRRNVTLKRSTAGTYMGVGMLSGRSSGKSCIELPDGGVYMVGGYPVQGMTQLASSAADGSQFSKNFRNVDTNTMYAAGNAEAYFEKPASDSSWSNIPTARTGTAWTGLRRVIWISGTSILILIIEMVPQAGRIWTNYYDGSAWTGWRYTASTT